MCATFARQRIAPGGEQFQTISKVYPVLSLSALFHSDLIADDVAPGRLSLFASLSLAHHLSHSLSLSAAGGSLRGCDGGERSKCSLEKQPHVKSLRSSYTGLYPQFWASLRATDQGSGLGGVHW